MELLHKSNIILHVITGAIALILGVFALLTVKGGTTFSRFCFCSNFNWFDRCLCIRQKRLFISNHGT